MDVLKIDARRKERTAKVKTMTKENKLSRKQQLRESFLADKINSWSDEMILELLLGFSIPRKNVKQIAQELIHTFGSLCHVLSASPDQLSEVKGINLSSTILLKAIDFIRKVPLNSGDEIRKSEKTISRPHKHPHDLSSDIVTKRTSTDLINKEPQNSKASSVPVKSIVGETTSVATCTCVTSTHPSTSEPLPSSVKKSPPKKRKDRKFQVSNGYLLEFDQLARILNFLLEHMGARRIKHKILQENTGLAKRQVESLVSIGTAMGLIKPRHQILTPIGELIAKNDIFIEKKGTLEWCHYMGAGSYRNLVWFEIFNRLLPESSPMTQREWTEQLRHSLAGQYTKRTITKSLYEEVRFVVDAYLKRNFSKLELLQQLSDGRLYRHRYTEFTPLILCAMIYDFCTKKKTHAFELDDMANTPGSPAVVFGLDAASIRQQIEKLHDLGWLRYETAHNLDQVRLKPGFSTAEFLRAHFEEREPTENASPLEGYVFE